MQETDQLQTCLITRDQYNQLIHKFQKWMASDNGWLRLKRDWLTGGVRLTIQPEQVNEFLEKCCSCGFNPGLVPTKG